jgi:hypothetical protein
MCSISAIDYDKYVAPDFFLLKHDLFIRINYIFGFLIKLNLIITGNSYILMGCCENRVEEVKYHQLIFCSSEQ